MSEPPIRGKEGRQGLSVQELKETDERSTDLRSRLREYGEIVFFTLLIAFVFKTFIVEAYRIPTASMENTLLVGDFLLVNKFVYGLQTPRHLPFTHVALPYFRLPGLRNPERGDVVVFEFPGKRGEIPEQQSLNFVKRCIGLPGDTLAIVDKQVIVNGKAISLPATARENSKRIVPNHYADMRMFPRGSQFNEDNYGPIVVPFAGQEVTVSRNEFPMWENLMQHEGHTVEFRQGKFFVDGTPMSKYHIEHDYYFMIGDNRDNSLDSRFWGFVPDDLILGKVMFVYWSCYDSGGGFLQCVKTARWGRIGTIIR